jgi:hypothetical protein
MEFTSLRSIIYDLLHIIRGAKIADDEPISERQLENWIHQYRAKLLKQDLDKGKYLNPDYIQEYQDEDGNPLSIVPNEQELRTVYRTSVQIPKTIDLNYKSGIIYLGDVNGNRIQLVPEARVNFQQYKKITSNSTIAYLKDRYVYLYNHNGLQYIRLRGVFEIPTEIPGYDLDEDKYPIPVNLLPTLKEMILKNELGIIYKAPNDDENDTEHKVQSDVRK